MSKVKNKICVIVLCLFAMMGVVFAASLFASAAVSSPLTYNSTQKVYTGTLPVGEIESYTSKFTDSIYSNYFVAGKYSEIQSASGYTGNYKTVCTTLYGSEGTKSKFESGTSPNLRATVSYGGNITSATYSTMMTSGTNASAQDLQGYIIFVEEY